MRGRRTWMRDAAAVLAAALVHASLFLYVQVAALRVHPLLPPTRIDLRIVEPEEPPPPPPVDEPPPPPPEPPPPPKEPPPPPPETAPPTPAPTPVPPPDVAPPPPTSPPTVVDDGPGSSMVRLPRQEGGAMGRVLGSGGNPLGPSLGALEGSLDFKAQGAISDKVRAEKNAKRLLLDDMSQEDVRAGLADDYFRVLQDRIETAWRPSVNDLNDAGKQVSQIGFMTKAVTDPGEYGEMWQAYLDVAKQYARGEKPSLTEERRERLRELMRSRDTSFRFNTITELRLWQGPDGRVLTIEILVPSGHPLVDEGIRDAIKSAIDAMPDPPPERLHRGRTFKSNWRLRATWTMVPPTAWLQGAGFDITPQGVQVDVPFEIKLKTNILLQSIDTRSTELP